MDKIDKIKTDTGKYDSDTLNDTELDIENYNNKK